MTTSNNDNEQKPRDINDLIDLPYSEMTEKEIEIVIEFKAAIKARDENHLARLQIAREAAQKQQELLQDMADKATKTLDDLVDQAINRYVDAS